MQRSAGVLPSGAINRSQSESRNSQTVMLPQQMLPRQMRPKQTSILLLPQCLQAAATTPTSGKETA